MKLKTFLFTLCLLLIATVGWATDWYVRPAGGNYGTEDGTSYENAWDGFSSIVWGSGGVQAGDTLWLDGSATYNEQLKIKTSGTSGSYITIRGDYGGSKATIDGQGTIGRILHLDTNDYLLIKYLKLLNSANYGIASQDSGNPGTTDNVVIQDCWVEDAASNGINLTGSNVIIRNCFVLSTPATGIYVVGPSVDNILIENCVVTGCGTDGSNTDGIFAGNDAGNITIVGNHVINQLGGASIDVSNTTGGSQQNVHIAYNVIENGATGIKGGDEDVADIFYIYYNLIVSGGNQITCNNNGIFYVVNNILVNSIANSLLAIATIGSRTIHFYNNVCYGPVGRYLRVLSTGLTLSSNYNCFYNSGSGTPFYYDAGMDFSSWKTTTSGDSNSLEQDPLLTSTYQLSRNSPCIDAGTQVPGVHDQPNWRDLSGNTQHYGTAPDIGCYEYNSDLDKRWSRHGWGLGKWGVGRWKVNRWYASTGSQSLTFGSESLYFGTEPLTF